MRHRLNSIAKNDRQVSARKAAYVSVAAIVVITVFLTGYLLDIGERGGTIATVIGVPIAVTGILIGLVHRGEQSTERQVSLRAVVLTTVLSVAVGGGAWWLHGRHSDGAVDFGPSFTLAENSPKTVAPSTDEIPWRGRLTFTPKLASADPLTNCVWPARLQITAIVDGERLRQRVAKHDEPVRISIPGGSRDVELEITLDEPVDQECLVTATLAQAYLER